MNADTGKIEMMSLEVMSDFQSKMIEIEEKNMTDKQRKEMRVSLHDHRSILGKQLTEYRQTSKYTPHVGAKQQAKIDARSD